MVIFVESYLSLEKMFWRKKVHFCRNTFGVQIFITIICSNLLSPKMTLFSRDNFLSTKVTIPFQKKTHRILFGRILIKTIKNEEFLDFTPPDGPGRATLPAAAVGGGSGVVSAFQFFAAIAAIVVVVSAMPPKAGHCLVRRCRFRHERRFLRSEEKNNDNEEDLVQKRRPLHYLM
jgi:hypothetical protein